MLSPPNSPRLRSTPAKVPFQGFATPSIVATEYELLKNAPVGSKDIFPEALDYYIDQYASPGSSKEWMKKYDPALNTQLIDNQIMTEIMNGGIDDIIKSKDRKAIRNAYNLLTREQQKIIRTVTDIDVNAEVTPNPVQSELAAERLLSYSKLINSKYGDIADAYNEPWVKSEIKRMNALFEQLFGDANAFKSRILPADIAMSDEKLNHTMKEEGWLHVDQIVPPKPGMSSFILSAMNITAQGKPHASEKMRLDVSHTELKAKGIDPNDPAGMKKFIREVANGFFTARRTLADMKEKKLTGKVISRAKELALIADVIDKKVHLEPLVQGEGFKDDVEKVDKALVSLVPAYGQATALAHLAITRDPKKTFHRTLGALSDGLSRTFSLNKK